MPHESTSRRTNSLRTSHFMLHWRETQKETISVDSDDVSVCENVLDLNRGWSQRRQLLRHVLEDPLEHGRSPEDTTLAYNSLRMSTPHCMKDVSCTPLASVLLKHGWKNALTQWKRFTPAVVKFVWELKGLLSVGIRSRFELCVVIHDNVAHFLFDITTGLPLCGCRERVPALSEELHKISKKSRPTKAQCTETR